ncbi:hypothetical protein BDV98DRAFT_502919, partial [Pterulicium gracile]
SSHSRLSGLSHVELDMTLTRLKALQATLILEEAEAQETLAVKLSDIITLLESRVNSPLVRSLHVSAVNDDILDQLNIKQLGWIYLIKLQESESLKQEIDATRKLGVNETWSNDYMYKNLTFLFNNSPRTSEAASRLIIDTFLFRAACMIPSDRKVVMELEKPVPVVKPLASKLHMLSGYIDYTVLLTAPKHHREPISCSVALETQKCSGFFAAEGKVKVDGTSQSQAQFAQTVAELVACAKHLRQKHIRGALTSGLTWIFIVVDIDTEGANFWRSPPITLRYPEHEYPTSFSPTSGIWDPAFIATVLSTWIQKSSSKFEGGQWFYKEAV